MRKLTLLTSVLGITLGAITFSACQTTKKDTYTKDGKLKVSFRNLYFGDYGGKGDSYIREIEKMFNISIKVDTYDWANWSAQVNGQVKSGSLPDVFHANIDSYNFASNYKYWAEEEIVKPLPDDLSRWPNIKTMIENTTNIDSLKLDGKLYGIPIAKNTTDYTTTFSPFTYIYRRDWAKQYGVYQENDEYTWAQFTHLLEVFTQRFANTSRFALGDVEWGFPSITNFYKQVPHCFAQDENGNYVNNYTTQAYLTGLEMSKTFATNRWYYRSQNTARDGDLNKAYFSNQCGVLYENLSYSNYVTLKNELKSANTTFTEQQLDDATAIMKIKGEDGKYVLEGTDNWFSMTFFDNKISDTKMEIILDLYDYLLSEEGTLFSIYGFEGYDYVKNGDNIELVEEYWPKNKDGSYAKKDNGAKYLRYMVSLGYDTLSYDPLTNKKAYNYLNDWELEMKEALANNELKVLKETKEVMWLTTPLKAKNSGILRTKALEAAMKYVYGTIKTQDKFIEAVTNSTWDDVLEEINAAIGPNSNA